MSTKLLQFNENNDVYTMSLLYDILLKEHCEIDVKNVFNTYFKKRQFTRRQILYFFKNYEHITYDETNIKKYVDLLSFFLYKNGEEIVNHIVKLCYISENYMDLICNYYIVQCVIHKTYVELLQNCVSITKSTQIEQYILYLNKYVPLEIMNHCNNHILFAHFKHFTQLKKLICNFFIRPINDILKHFTNLQHLEIIDCKFITFDSIQNLTQLTHLTLHANNTISDQALVNLINLQYLCIRYNTKFTNFSVSKLINLKTLIIDTEDNITDECLEKLTQLSILDITSNKNITINGVAKLKNLKVLILDDNKKIYDCDLKLLQNIEHLHIRFNNVITIEGIKFLNNLKIINADYSNLIDSDYQYMTDVVKIKICQHRFPNNECVE